MILAALFIYAHLTFPPIQIGDAKWEYHVYYDDGIVGVMLPEGMEYRWSGQVDFLDPEKDYYFISINDELADWRWDRGYIKKNWFEKNYMFRVNEKTPNPESGTPQADCTFAHDKRMVQVVVYRYWERKLDFNVQTVCNSLFFIK
jgi:hypothetical protein